MLICTAYETSETSQNCPFKPCFCSRNSLPLFVDKGGLGYRIGGSWNQKMKRCGLSSYQEWKRFQMTIQRTVFNQIQKRKRKSGHSLEDPSDWTKRSFKLWPLTLYFGTFPSLLLQDSFWLNSWWLRRFPFLVEIVASSFFFCLLTTYFLLSFLEIYLTCYL